MKCKFEHDEDCCNCGSPQYMCKCKPSICGCVVPITNADRFRAMSGKELKAWYCKNRDCGTCDFCRPFGCTFEDWLQQPAEEEHHETG